MNGVRWMGTEGPPRVGSSRPEMASIASRRLSPSSTAEVGAVPARVVRVQLFGRGVKGGAAHLPGPRKHQLPNQMFEGPPRLPEISRQPIEQCRMGRRIAQRAEIVDRRHQAATEEMCPHPVDGDPRKQWIVRVHHRFSQLPPAAPLADREALGRGQGFQEPACHRIAGSSVVATNKHRLVPAIGVRHGRDQHRFLNARLDGSKAREVGCCERVRNRELLLDPGRLVRRQGVRRGGPSAQGLRWVGYRAGGLEWRWLELCRKDRGTDRSPAVRLRRVGAQLGRGIRNAEVRELDPRAPALPHREVHRDPVRLRMVQRPPQ